MKKKIFLLLFAAVFFTAVAGAQDVGLELSFAYPLMFSEGTDLNYLKIGLNGPELNASENERPPVNAAIVLDVSGSMSGDKLKQAVLAAHTAIDMLKNGDVVAVITYSDYAQVLVPAAALTSRNRTAFHNALDRVYADGYTALFSGVSMGANELDNYLDEKRVSRVILLSDGLANVGPSTPGELGNLGKILKKRGISVSTIGLGADYNDALMFELAARSDGNHAFVEHPSELVSIFEKEFETLLRVVARDFEIRIRFGEGVTPLNILNRTGEIYNGEVVLTLNQLYSLQEQYVIIECETESGAVGTELQGASVTVSYLNLISGKKDTLKQSASIRFVNDSEEVARARDVDTLRDVVLQTATATNMRAVELRDQGKVDEAKNLLNLNSEYLENNALDLEDEKLKGYAKQNREEAELLDEEDWNKQRKIMRDSQFENQMQQQY